jgi:hypothetical protein
MTSNNNQKYTNRVPQTVKNVTKGIFIPAPHSIEIEQYNIEIEIYNVPLVIKIRNLAVIETIVRLNKQNK